MLTVVFTLSIPITIINTIHDMNISLPGSQLNQFQFLGKYTTLILVILILISNYNHRYNAYSFS